MPQTRLCSEDGAAPSAFMGGGPLAGTYRERLILASGRFAMIDDGIGFQLVPWRPALECISVERCQVLQPEGDE